jgi:hypothetical protein
LLAGASTIGLRSDLVGFLGSLVVVARITREFAGILVDTTLWPVLLCEFPEKRVPDPEFREALSYIEQLMRDAVASREKCYQVTDITRVREIAPATQRKYAAEFIKRNASLSVAATLGTGSVTPSSILRGIMTAVYWISPSPTPATFFATRDEAYLHAVKVLEGIGALLPPKLLELKARAQASQRARQGSRGGP